MATYGRGPDGHCYSVIHHSTPLCIDAPALLLVAECIMARERKTEHTKTNSFRVSYMACEYSTFWNNYIIVELTLSLCFL
jgi:hypothetical protein